MNRIHQWYCASKWWRRHIPPLLQWGTHGLDLASADVLELGSGPGLTTDWLVSRVATLTTIDTDAAAVKALQNRHPGINACHGDATALPFTGEQFDLVVCFTMLHHVPSEAAQDHLFIEACRVLRPGGAFAGTDSTGGPLFRVGHVGDTMTLLDPGELADRLLAAGFNEPTVRTRGHDVRWHAERTRAGLPT
jgi:SAM-dependent methyltransferase